jgi:HemY protein
MWRTLFWLLGLFASAIALALLMGQNDAVWTLFWHPYRFDLSFNLVLILWLLCYGLIYMAWQSVVAIRRMPVRAFRWRLQQKERAVHAALMDAFSHQMAGRFVRAKQLANVAIDHLQHGQANASLAQVPKYEQMCLLAHFMAAEAEHALQAKHRRDEHVAHLLKPTHGGETLTALQEGAMLRSIRWAIQDRQLSHAMQLLGQLPGGVARRTQALRLRLRLAQLTQDTPMALETARLLAKHGAFSSNAAAALLTGLFLERLKHIQDPDVLRQFWTQLDAKERQQPDRVLALMQRLMAMHDEQALSREQQQWIREVLQPVWERYAELLPSQRLTLVKMLECALQEVNPTWLDRVESMQKNHPTDALLQYLAAQTFFQRQLWGKSTQFFNWAILKLTDSDLQTRSWCRLAELAEKRGDAEQAAAAWKRAAQSGLAIR